MAEADEVGRLAPTERDRYDPSETVVPDLFELAGANEDALRDRCEPKRQAADSDLAAKLARFEAHVVDSSISVNMTTVKLRSFSTRVDT